MTSSNPGEKGKGKAPDLSSTSTSSTAVLPAQTTSTDTPSQQDEQPTPSLFNRIGASATGLGRDIFAGGAGGGGEGLRRDARGLLVAVGNGKGGSTSARTSGNGNGNGGVGYTHMHTGNGGVLDGSSLISGGKGDRDTRGMRSAGIVGISGRGNGIQGVGEWRDEGGNTVRGSESESESERARWIQQNEKEFSEFLDGVPSLTPAGDAGFEGGYSGSSYERHESIPQDSLGNKFQYEVLPAPTGASLDPMGKQAFEDSWARSAQGGNNQRETHSGSRAMNTREPTVYYFEPLPASHPEEMTEAEYRRKVLDTNAREDSWSRAAHGINNQYEAHSGPRATNTRGPTVYYFEPLPASHPEEMSEAEYRRELINTTAHRDAGYMHTNHHDISVQEQESRDGDEIRDLLSRVGGVSFEEESAGLNQGMSEGGIEGEDMKAYEREWMGMSSVERDRIIQVTRDLFPEEVKNGGGVVHGGFDVENSLNLFPGHEREAEEKWREEKIREMQREEEEEEDDDDDDEFEGEVLNFQGIEWRVRKEKKIGKARKEMKGKAEEEWKSDWEGVLRGYTDEVWGGLTPLVREAREELKIEEEKGDENEGERKEKGNVKALRRLGAVLGHLRGMDGSAK